MKWVKWQIVYTIWTGISPENKKKNALFMLFYPPSNDNTRENQSVQMAPLVPPIGSCCQQL